MTKAHRMFLTLALVLAGTAACLRADPVPNAPRVRVRATGQADRHLINAREGAIEDALRRCVEVGGGVELASASKSEEFRLAADEIYTKTAGFIERYDVLKENPDNQGVWEVQVEAIVTRGDIDANLLAFKALLKRKGMPRVMIVGSADGKPFDSRLTAQLQGQLERRGIRVIDADRLNVTARADAERVARGELDPKKAALMTQKTGADVLAIVSVQGEQLPAEDLFGQKRYPVDAVAIVKLLRADTAEVLASQVVEQRGQGDTQAQAVRSATSAVALAALQASVKDIARHWLEDVDQRGGQEVSILLHQFPFRRTAALVESLRKVGGVRDVIIKQTDAEAVGELVVRTNASAADVGIVLTKIDPNLQIITSTENRLDVR